MTTDAKRGETNSDPIYDAGTGENPGHSEPETPDIETGGIETGNRPRPASSRSSPAPADLPPRRVHPAETELMDQVGAKEERKLRARRERHKGVWFGLGMFGLVGWSVAVPTLAAIALGVWIDTRFPSQYSWTLMLLVMGIALGCFNAWYWVSRERDRL